MAPPAVQFTAHNVRLDDGTAIRSPRDERIVLVHLGAGFWKPSFPGTEPRLADVGCLEGRYAVGFARMDFKVLGIRGSRAEHGDLQLHQIEDQPAESRFVHDNASASPTTGSSIPSSAASLFYHLENRSNTWKPLSSVTNKLLILRRTSRSSTGAINGSSFAPDNDN